MARVKPKKQLPTLSSWDEVDLALKAIGDHQRAIEAIERIMQEETDTAKLKAKAASDPEHAKIAAISQQIEAFAEAHRADLKTKKTLQLVFGQIGWRKTTKVSLPKDKERVSELMRLLKSVGWNDCIIDGEPTISKEQIKTHDFAEVTRLGIKIKIDDDFWFETDRDDLPTKE